MPGEAAPEEILAADGNEMILVKYAKHLLWAAGGKAQRKEILDRLARWFRYNPPGRGTVGIYYYHQGDQARSQELLREMLEAAPDNAQVRLYVAYGLEDPEEVHQLFRQLQGLLPARDGPGRPGAGEVRGGGRVVPAGRAALPDRCLRHRPAD